MFCKDICLQKGVLEVPNTITNRFFLITLGNFSILSQFWEFHIFYSSLMLCRKYCFFTFPISLFAISGKARIFSFLNKFHTHKSRHVILLNYLLSNCSRFYCYICCKHQMVFIDMKHYSTWHDIKLRQGLDDMYVSVWNVTK